MKRFFNKTSISQIGTVACVGLCLIILVSTIFSLISGYINDKENLNAKIIQLTSDISSEQDKVRKNQQIQRKNCRHKKKHAEFQIV